MPQVLINGKWTELKSLGNGEFSTGNRLFKISHLPTSIIGKNKEFIVTPKGSTIKDKPKPKVEYRSAYNPDDIIKGFNALTLGGLNNLSPTQWARRYYDLNRLLISQIPGSKRTMTWSGFVNNWLNGNNGLVSEKFAQEHPYLSMGINGVGDIVALGGIANANKINLVGNIATKHGNSIAKVTIDVAKNSSKPFNWRNYKFLGDSRFYSDLDDAGYKTIITERLSGNYPLTLTERRNYITGLKNDIQKGIDYAKQEAINNVTTPIKKEIIVSPENRMFDLSKVNSYSDIQMLTPHFGTLKATKQYGKTPWEGNYGAFRNSEKGLFFPFRDKPNTLRTHSMFLDLGERISTGAHETRHTVLSYFDIPLVETRPDLPGTYGRYTNRKLPLDFKKKVNEYINDALTAGEWEGSLGEMDAELTGWSAKHGFPRYSQMNPQQKALLYDLFLKRFGGASDYKNYGEISSLLKLNPDYNTSLLYSKILDNSKIGQIILGLETLGYRKQGGKMNILEFLKNGSGIHIKKKNRGKFTEYCGGKVTDECIRKAKVSGNPTLVKRATFAANARKWKHKEGGIIKALEGTKTSWWLKAGNFLNSDAGKGILNLGSSLISGIGNSSKAADYGQEFDNATNATVLAMLKKQYAKNKNLGMQYALLYINYLNQMNPDQHFGEIDKQMLSELFAKLLVDEDDINEYKLLRALEKALLILAIQGSGSGFGDVLSQGLGLLGNYLGNKKTTNSTTQNLSSNNSTIGKTTNSITQYLLSNSTIGKSTNPYMDTNLGGFVNNPTNKFFWAPSVKDN